MRRGWLEGAWGIAAILVALVVGVSGCDSAESGGDAAARTASPSPLAPTSPPSSASTNLPIHPTAGDWRPIRRWPRDDPAAGFAVANATHVVVFDAGARGMSRVETPSGRLLAVHSLPGSAWLAQDAWLTDDLALFEDVHPHRRLVRVSAYDIGAPHVGLDLGFINPSDTAPSMDVSQGHLVYVAGSPDTGMCVQVQALRAAQGHGIDCAPSGVIVDDVSTTDAGISYSTLVGAGGEDRCKRLSFVDWTGEHLTALEQMVNDHADCIAWSGTFVAGGIAWDEVDPDGGGIGAATAFFSTLDQEITRIGTVDTDSIVACGGNLYWKAGNPQDSTSIYAWSPGAEHATQSLNHHRNEVATHPACTDGRYLTSRVDDISGEHEDLTIMRLDTLHDTTPRPFG